MIKNIKYSIKKHNNLGDKVEGNYVLWKEVESERGWGVKGIFQGTKEECKNKLNEIRGDKND